MTDETIFAAALNLPEPDRLAYLDRACSGNPDLRREVEALLAAHVASNPLDRPADLGRTGAYDGEVPAADPQGSPAIGDRIGRYKLMERVGEGGMGEVWVADQLEPIRRRVALKVIKPGMDSRSVLARFEAERQALALMDHPNIAKVLDAGTTADGRPFFVMELVKGTPITQFCDARKLSARERLELFVPVCQAIQHAHTKGVIHRDVKPSNVLVELHDDAPVPKVIDFGVAKAIGQQLSEKTIYTGLGALVGTPAYMAPEQATFNALDVDTRADVYALGVLLYELLVGSPPFEPERLRLAALDEILRLVREEEPPRPSARLSTSQAKASIAAVRRSDPVKLSNLMRGELDWIVMKALEKDRARRYDTATGFAQDVQRYLAGEPVQAVPPSPVYRLRKFVRRHRGPVIAAGLVAIAAAAGLIGAGYGLLESQKQREVTVLLEQTEQARTEAVAARELLADEQRQTERAREDLARVEYARSIDLAHREYHANNLERAAELLDACRPDLRGWEWGYVHRLLNENLVTLPHDARVTGAAFNRDRTRMVTAQSNGTIRLWDAASSPVGRFTAGGASQLDSVRFSPDGARLLTASMDQTARVWDADTGKELLKLPHSEVVYDAVYSPDGTRIATSCQDRIARVWDARTGAIVTEVKRYTKLYGPIAFHPDGTKVLTIDGDQAVRIWDAATGAEHRTIELGDYPRAAAFGPDGSKVACALADKTARLFDAATGKQLQKFDAHWGDIQALAFSPDGSRLVVGGRDHTTRLWDTATGAELAVLRGHAAPINALAFNSDGTRLISTSDDRTARVWDARNLPGPKVFRPNTGVFALAPSPDGSSVAVGGTHGEVQVWDLRTGKAVWTARHESGWVPGLAFRPDGRRLATGGKDEVVRVWDAKTGEGVVAMAGHRHAVECVAYHPTGAILASASTDNTVRIWDPETKTAIRVIDHPGPVWAVEFSPDGSLLATGGWDDQVRLWDTNTWQLVRTNQNPAHMVRTIRFSRDGTHLAARATGGKVAIWDTRTWDLTRVLPCLRQEGISMALSPDGSRAVTSGKDGNVQVWDTRSGAELLTLVFKELRLSIHPATVYPMAFTNDGSRLITGSFDESFRLWDATSAGPDRPSKKLGEP